MALKFLSPTPWGDLRCSSELFEFVPLPTLAITGIWGVNQWLTDPSRRVFLFVTQPFKEMEIDISQW